MRDILAIDGPRGAGKTVVAAAVAAELGWRLVGLPDLSGPDSSGPDSAREGCALHETGLPAGPAVVEGQGVLLVAATDARWKFHLEADPRQRALRLAGAGAAPAAGGLLAELLEEERALDATGCRRLAPDVILFDTTDQPASAVAAAIAAIVRADME